MTHKEYDFLIVGSGLFGSVFAQIATERGYKCLVVDKRSHTGGNTYCKNIENINVHYYGAHIFHTSDEEVWRYLNRFVRFNNFINSPLANYNNKLYNLPFNMNTFNQLWGVTTADEAKRKISEQQGEYANIEPQNLEEQALQLVGRDIYEKFIKGYTEKQWGRKATELPSFIIRRIPLRFIYDNNYFNDIYQGIPIGGYNALINKLLEGCSIILGVDFLEHREELASKAERIIYSGMLDAYFDYKLGRLEYRSLRFENEILNTNNYQSNAVINYTSADVPYTRIIEHKHFEFGKQAKSVITREYPEVWNGQNEPYYPINDAKNDKLANEYKKLASKEKNVYFGGRLADYKYYDMDKVVKEAIELGKKIFKISE